MHALIKALYFVTYACLLLFYIDLSPKQTKLRLFLISLSPRKPYSRGNFPFGHVLKPSGLYYGVLRATHVLC